MTVPRLGGEAQDHAIRRFHDWLVAALVALGVASLAACGTSASSATPSNGCAPGQTYCAACDGGGFCSATCPGLECPAPSQDGGADAARGADGGAGGTGCPASAPDACLDCNGATFCVMGPCPASTCPASPEAGSILYADAGASPSAEAGASGCRSNADCTSPQQCASPFSWLPYPAPLSMTFGSGFGECNSDLDCAPDGGNSICETICGGACLNRCNLGCSGPASCPEGTSCAVSHRCALTACTGPSDCPTQFDCVQGSCARRACQKDADCVAGGYCVGAQCSSSLGTCANPPGADMQP